MIESGIEVRDEFAFHRSDHVFDQKLALFQATNSQLVNHRVVLQAIDQVVKISVTDPQLAKSFQLFKGLGINFVGA